MQERQRIIDFTYKGEQLQRQENSVDEHKRKFPWLS